MVDGNNKNVRSISQVKQDDKLEIYVSDGKIITKVQDVSALDIEKTAGK